LYEGAVWINGALYFSDFTFASGFPSRIQKLTTAGVMTTQINDSGSNGLAVDAQGDIIAATHKYSGISRFDIATGNRTAVASTYNGHVFTSPNDLAIANDGTLYFTDPNYQHTAGVDGQPITGVYRVDVNGQVSLIDGSLNNPNGIALSPENDVLYVNGNSSLLRTYPIVNGQVFSGTDLVQGLTEPDGMAVDCHGNIYVAEHSARRLRVFSPNGSQLATISVDANVTNAAFGGDDGKTLYITGAKKVWKIDLDVTGSPY
jgi:gluconolactonase